MQYFDDFPNAFREFQKSGGATLYKGQQWWAVGDATTIAAAGGKDAHTATREALLAGGLSERQADAVLAD